MNRRQEERVADLGRAFQEALTEIINMEEPAQDEAPALEVCERYAPVEETEIEAYEREEVCRPMPVVDMNDKLAQYDVTIKHVHNGFIVSVGCQTFVFESFDKLAKYMAIYYDDPRGTYEKHYKGELLKQYL
jgi:hypothetical protein